MLISVPVAFAQELPHLAELQGAEKKYPNIDSRLADMYDSLENNVVPTHTTHVTPTSNSHVQVVLEMASADSIIPENLGIITNIIHEDMVLATIPVRNMVEIENDENIQTIRMPSYPQLTDHVTSEGTQIIRSDLINSVGHTGRNVKIAVIDLGFDIHNSEIARNVSSYQSFWEPRHSIENQNELQTKHGTAVAEIVLDVAPDAQLYLYDVNTQVGFLNMLDQIIARGDIDIIIMSLGWYNVGPLDGTSAISQKVNEARENNILFIVAAGNETQKHWQGRFTDYNNDGWHDFQVNDNTNWRGPR